MSEDTSSLDDIIEIPPENIPKGKTPKQKKRLSSFEIVRSIFQKTSERKLPFLLKNMGEDPDLYFLCSENEEGFLFGSSELSIGLIEITSDELKEEIQSVFSKINGMDYPEQIIVNIKDQISDLGKTKGESIPSEVIKGDHGSTWVTRQDKNGNVRLLYFSKAVESLFHFQTVQYFCKKYRYLLTATDSDILLSDYKYDSTKTSTVVTIPPDENNPLMKLFPHGFRVPVTKGRDILITKDFDNLPYPLLKEELVFFITDGSTCQVAHRLTGEGWRMILLRPNSVLFPTSKITIQSTGLVDL